MSKDLLRHWVIWIPTVAGGEFPPDAKTVLVTVAAVGVVEASVQQAWFVRHKKVFRQPYDKWNGPGWYDDIGMVGGPVIAWQPMPEPWGDG